MAIAQYSGFLMVLQFHILCGIVIFFALFSEVSAKDETEKIETLSIRSGGAGFAVWSTEYFLFCFTS